MDKISVVVIDDHPLFLEGVVNALKLEAYFHVVGQAMNGKDGFDLICNLVPDVAIVDINLPRMNGIQLTREVTNRKYPTRVILMTAYDDEAQQIHAMHAGAYAYCNKETQPEKLVAIIHKVLDGRYVLGDKELNADAFKEWLHNQSIEALRVYSDPGEPYQPLSTREMEVLEYITHGNSNKEIATILSISPQTVKNHVTSILRKLGVNDRTQAALFAVQRGWVRIYHQKEEAEE